MAIACREVVLAGRREWDSLCINVYIFRFRR